MAVILVVLTRSNNNASFGAHHSKKRVALDGIPVPSQFYWPMTSAVSSAPRARGFNTGNIRRSSPRGDVMTSLKLKSADTTKQARPAIPCKGAGRGPPEVSTHPSEPSPPASLFSHLLLHSPLLIALFPLLFCPSLRQVRRVPKTQGYSLLPEPRTGQGRATHQKKE
ncbi:hypothetical protein VTI74DRAFT_3376 [Chaetomium olivicolor]